MNVKVNDNQRKEIVLGHYLDNSNANIQYLMNKYNLSKQGLYNIINSKNSKKYINEYQPNLTENLQRIINKGIKRLEDAVDAEDIKPLDLAKIIGIVYDKMRLENDLSTENKSININISIEK